MRHTTITHWFFSRRPEKIETTLGVSISLQDAVTGEIHPAVLSGTVTECTEDGARLQLAKLMADGKHIFFSTLDSERYHLLLDFDLLAQIDQPTEVTAQSIWMDSGHQDNRIIFTMGIRFLENQKSLLDMLRSCEQQEWPERLCNAPLPN